MADNNLDLRQNISDTFTIKSKVSVAESKQYLTIPAIIRRIVDKTDSKDGINEYGIEFALLEDNDKLLLHRFVYEQMTKTHKLLYTY